MQLFSDKILAALYFIACVACAIVFFNSHRWGYLVAAGVWLAMGIYCLVTDKDNTKLRK